MKVLATNVSNLTDARYFAAWGVDCLVFEGDPNGATYMQPPQMKEIVEWVEGPEVGISYEGISVPENAEEIAASIEWQHLIIGPFIDRKDLPNAKNIYRKANLDFDFSEDEKVIVALEKGIKELSASEESKLRELASSKELFLLGGFGADDLKVVEDLGVEGIVLQGGEEEKVGYKSYDELDDILEELYP